MTEYEKKGQTSPYPPVLSLMLQLTDHQLGQLVGHHKVQSVLFPTPPTEVALPR